MLKSSWVGPITLPSVLFVESSPGSSIIHGGVAPEWTLPVIVVSFSLWNNYDTLLGRHKNRIKLIIQNKMTKMKASWIWYQQEESLPVEITICNKINGKNIDDKMAVCNLKLPKLSFVDWFNYFDLYTYRKHDARESLAMRSNGSHRTEISSRWLRNQSTTSCTGNSHSSTLLRLHCIDLIHSGKNIT